MEYLLESKKFNEIESICEEYGIENYTINSDGSIDVDGYVNLSNEVLTKLPLKFNIVSGGFNCSHNKLTSLKGCPVEVGGYFICNHNQLISLEGYPKEVVGRFNCSHNKLTTLKGAPKVVNGNFNFYNNPLPNEVLINYSNIEYIIKNQDVYSIWKTDGTLDIYRFNQMMEDKDI